LHCHGGREVVAMLLDLFAARGVRPCGWEEWERRTAASPLRAEAAIALAHALTPRTALILLDQHEGALGRALGEIRCAPERRGGWRRRASAWRATPRPPPPCACGWWTPRPRRPGRGRWRRRCCAWSTRSTCRPPGTLTGQETPSACRPGPGPDCRSCARRWRG